MKREFSKEISRMQNELTQQVQASEELVRNYEAMLGEFRDRLTNERQVSAELRSKVSEFESERDALKSLVTNAQIEAKTEQVKFANLEEKLKRDHSLFESQMKLKMLNLEAARHQEIENVKSEQLKDAQSFLIQVCEQFREHFYFGEKICVQSVLQLLAKVSDHIKSLEAKCTAMDSNALAEVRQILKISGNSQVVPEIQRLLSFHAKFEKFSDQFSHVEQIQAELANWEQWGRRIHSLATDGFALFRSARELQFAIEEAILTAIGQKIVWRRAEILRVEKRLLLGGLRDEKPRKLSVNSLGLAISAILRLRKLSGHANGVLEFPEMKCVGEVATVRPSRKNFPVFRVRDP